MSGEKAPTTPEERALELRIARRAVRHGLLPPRALVESLFEQSAGGGARGLVPILCVRGLLTSGQAEELQLELLNEPPGPDAADGPDPFKGKIVHNVRCDLPLDRRPFLRSYAGKRPHEKDPVTAHLIPIDAMRHGLWMDFLETVRAAQGLEHPNLLQILDVGRGEGCFVVVTTFRPGGITLTSLIQRVRRLKFSEALRIVREVGQGLQALHGRGLAHRDVQPQNVLLGRQGEVQLQHPGVVYEPPGAQELGERASIFGTPHYMAPEAIKGGPQNPKSDVYELGVLAYELSTGVLPFEGETLADLAPQHLKVAPLPPQQFLRGFPEDWTELLVWMLGKEPNDRPSAEQVVKVVKSIEKKIPRTGLTQKLEGFKG